MEKKMDTGTGRVEMG